LCPRVAFEPTEDVKRPPAAARSSWQKARDLAERHALLASFGVLGIFVLVVGIGVAIRPDIFYDHYVWRDLYGSLVVDAHQCASALTCPGVSGPAGIYPTDGYTWGSELTFAFVLAVLLYGVYYGILREREVRIDARFALALLPWIVLGPVGRVLEDADVFCRAGTHCDPNVFSFLFISPIVYMMIAGYVIASLLIGTWLRDAQSGPRRADIVVGIGLGVGFAAFAMISFLASGAFHALPPVWFAAIACTAAWFSFRSLRRSSMGVVNATVFAFGVPFAACSIFLVARWLVTGPWSAQAWSGADHTQAGFLVLGMSAVIALLVVAARYRWSHRRHHLDAGWESLGFAIVLGQGIDGLATWFALKDPFHFGLGSYGEKHPVGEILLRYWGGLLFPVAKLVLAIGLVWFFAREREAGRAEGKDGELLTLLAIAIFALGFGPGLRDTLRLMMGT